MNKAKILGGLLVALPLGAFAFTGATGTPVLANIALAGYGQDKVKICHKGNTIEVAAQAVQAHLGHGDVLGECKNGHKEDVNEQENEHEDANEHKDNKNDKSKENKENKSNNGHDR